MEEQIVQKKKGNGGLIVAFIIILLIAVAGSSFGGYYFGKQDNTKEEPGETGVVELKESDIKVLMDRIEVMDSHISGLYPITDVSTIPNQDLLSLGMRSGISAEQMERTIRYVIGDNVTVKHEDYMCEDASHGALIKYSNGWYSYNNDHPGHGGGGGYSATAFFKSAILKGTSIIVDTNLLYETTTDISGPRTSYYDGTTKNGGKEVLHDIERESKKAEYEKIKDTLPTTTFTFTQNAAGLYNLESVTIK